MPYLLVTKRLTDLAIKVKLKIQSKAFKDNLTSRESRLENYTLIITEKPDAAERIAMALDTSGKAQRSVDAGVPYYHADRNGEIIVVPALGHLYTVAGIKKEKNYPVFDYQWVPRHQAERGASKIRLWLKVISKFAQNASVFVDACDFDIEGSIIGFCILKYACGEKQNIAKRMKYSTLTKEELQKAYANLLPRLDFALVQAGLTRHEADWLYGINLSRALTSAVKNFSGQYTTISTGRVQGPTLKFLVIRERSIRSFVPTPYWSINAEIKVQDTVLEVEYKQKITEKKSDAQAVLETCKTAEGMVEAVFQKEFLLQPPLPFDLGALQSEAYRIFKYTPMRTLSIAQKLYLDALISYPRTSSQKLPPAIGYHAILSKLSTASAYQKSALKLLAQPVLKPNEGKKVDPAHPAIYPTGNLPSKPLDNAERNIFDLIVKRFMAVFGEPAIRQSVKVIFDINGKKFFLNTNRTLSEGWSKLYKPYVEFKEAVLPALIKGQKVEVKKVSLENNFTKPPARYNPRSLLLKMEKEGLGTKATRAGIIQTLYNRKYLLSGQSMVVTDLGFEVTEALRKYCPTIISSHLTKRLEEEMMQIQEGKKTKEEILAKVAKILTPVAAQLKEKETALGEQLSQAFKQSRLENNAVGACPNCHESKLVILRSKKTGKRFVGCTGYFEGKCKTAFPLPQTGTLKPATKACRSCGWPIIHVYLKPKKPWNLCLNPKCPTKKAEKNEM